jgi:glutamate racemase
MTTVHHLSATPSGATDNADRTHSASPDSAAIGVFDSGLGGLTVLRALLSALPDEHIVYLGDTARVPYGTRSAETVIRYARGCARVLTDRGVKAMVVACNTVSAVALDVLRAELDLPVIGVVDPGARAAVDAASTIAAQSSAPPCRIGVLGTAGTVASGAYTRSVGRLSTRLEVVARAAPLLVPLVEEGWLDGPLPELAVERYLEPLIAANVGVIVLGCTHYPVLKVVIERVARRMAGRDIRIVDSAEATAAAVQQQMKAGRIQARSASGASRLELLVTDLPASFEAVASRLLGQALPNVALIDLEV